LEDHIEKVLSNKKKRKKLTDEDVERMERIKAQADSYDIEEIGEIFLGSVEHCYTIFEFGNNGQLTSIDIEGIEGQSA
jgi:hypothetical protein